jgi:hypothetical protein
MLLLYCHRYFYIIYFFFIIFYLTNPSNIVSGYSTPSIANVGIGIKTVSGSNFLETIEASSSFHNIFNKLASVPSTPHLLPSVNIDIKEGSSKAWSDDGLIEDYMLDLFFSLSTL